MPKGQKGGSTYRRGGRQKGTKNKVSKREKMRQECEASGLTPLEYMISLLRDPAAPREERKWAAAQAAPYIHAKLQATTISGDKDAPLIPPTRRDELFGTVEQARRIAFVLARGSAAERELAEGDAPGVDTEAEPIPVPIPEPETTTEAPEPPAEPAEPPLPKHPYIFIEEGERERSGHRAWLAMEGRDVLNTFHGSQARQRARDWIAKKFGNSPCEEIEVPLPDEEGANHGTEE